MKVNIFQIGSYRLVNNKFKLRGTNSPQVSTQVRTRMDIPNSSYGGQSRAAPLRNSRSPPRNDYRGSGSQNRGDKPVSPLRSRVAQGMPNSQHSQQEEMYERSRQEELRRQIVEKERELETMSHKNKARLNRHADIGGHNASSGYMGLRQSSESGGYSRPQTSSNQYKRNSNSPLRAGQHSSGKKVNFTANYARSGSANGMTGSFEASRGPPSQLNPSTRRPPMPVHDNYVRQKSPKSPSALRQKLGSRSPTRDIDMRDASQGLMTVDPRSKETSPVRTASNEYINQLRQDNVSLEKRLNLVLLELDRVNRDRSNLVQKCSTVEQDVSMYQRQLNCEDDADAINQNLQLEVNDNRNHNVNYKRNITDADMSRADAIKNLRNLQADRDRAAHIVDELKGDLTSKLTLCKQLEQEQFKAHEQIRALEEQIASLNHQALQDNSQINDLQRVIDRLTDERDELQRKLDNLNRTYDNCVMEISRERAQMEGHNKHHNKLLVAKVTFTLLEHMFVKRKQEAMNEFFQYCKFDTKCHNTLKQFVKTVERLGQYKLKIAIKQWHQRTYKPIEMKLQKEDLCYEFQRKKLLTKMFNMWRQRQLDADGVYGAKNKALKAIWNAKAKDCGKEVQRAFQMWRDNLKFSNFKQQRVKRLIWRSYSNKLAKAWQKWLTHSQTMNNQVRMHVLARSFAEQQLLRITFNEMRFNLADMKRKRLNRLRTYVKAWKESNQYRKYMLAANMTVLGFKKDCNKSLLKTCFDALRQSKEEEKFILMSEALEGDCQPAIESLNKQIEVKTQVAVRSGRKRGLDAIKGMIYRQVAEYFNKWKGVQQRQTVMIDKNLKSMIIRRWQMSQRDAFNLWKLGKAHKEITMQQDMVMELQEEGSNMAQAVESLDKQIEIKKKQVDRSARSSLNRGTKIMQKRYLKQYLDKWASVNRHQNKQMDGSEVLLQKMRNRFLRQAFNLYKAGCAREQLADRNEGSCEQLKRALDVRKMKKCFTAMQKFNDKNMTAKRYWKILLGKMDHWMKKRAFATWMDGGNTMMIENCIEQQNQLTDEMTVKNTNLGNLTKKHADKTARNKALTANLEHMGQRSMANAFARAYFKRTARAFEQWKEWARADQHKKDLMRRMIDHMLKNSGKYLMAVMKNWKSKAGINERKEQISQLEYEMNDISLVQKGEEMEYQRQKAELENMTRTINEEKDKTFIKRSKMMALMTEQNQDCHFVGRLRAIWGAWRLHTQKQVSFSRNITNAIEKSMWQRGFQNIREFARDKHLTRQQNAKLAKIRSMYWKRNCGAAFSKWRQTEYENAMEMITMTEEQTSQMTEMHMQKKRVIQKQNITRSAKILNKQEKHKYYQAWRNITRWLKHKRVATETLLEAKSSYACMRLIKKWRARKDTTIAARGAFIKFHEKRENLYKRSVFRELMLKHHRDKALILRLSNAAKKFDSRNTQSAFQMIKNFAKSKENIGQNEKAVATKDLAGALAKLWRRKLLQHFTHMRRQIHGDKVVMQKKKIMFGHFISAQVRDAFNRWKKKAMYESTVVEVNEIGPVVEQVLDKRMDVANLKDLMTKEGFTPVQVNEISDKAEIKGDELLAKSIGRWKHWNGTDDYLIPKMFDRWRRFIAFRKIVKHWLDFLENRQQHQKADMSWCFNKWKHHFADKESHLQKTTYAQLMKRAVLAAKRLDKLADNTQQDEDMINHLSDQNQELFNNYRKSQRLALAMGRDNHRTGMKRAFSKFLDFTAQAKAAQGGGALGNNVGLIAALKDKMAELENDNESLANENEELRQFSLDGYQLGKNVQNLTSEREKLSVDLADKADTIKKLLDENERLSTRLRQAQESAQHLMRKSQAAQ